MALSRLERDTIRRRDAHLLSMFMVSAAEQATIQGAYEHSGEALAVLEARRLWPALSVEQARDCVRTIASWRKIEVPERPRPVRRR